ncbi:MAG: hypothetical protein ACUVWR_19195 [Anaerolineae bacterium]
MLEPSPHALLNEIVAACEQSAIVAGYSLRTLDLDILSLRVHLVDESFIEVFYNLASAKTAFALIRNGLRIYGKDNAKMGWHEHPLANPGAHRLCEPLSFAAFLHEVEKACSQS